MVFFASFRTFTKASDEGFKKRDTSRSAATSGLSARRTARASGEESPDAPSRVADGLVSVSSVLADGRGSRLFRRLATWRGLWSTDRQKRS